MTIDPGNQGLAIAEAAGISHASLFRIFPSKEDLAVALVARCNARIHERFAHAAEVSRVRGEAPGPAMGAAYGEPLADRDMVLVQLHAIAASPTHPAIRAAAQGAFRDLVARVQDATDAPAEAIAPYFAQGMLMNVSVALGPYEHDAPFARILTGRPVDDDGAPTCAQPPRVGGTPGIDHLGWIRPEPPGPVPLMPAPRALRILIPPAAALALAAGLAGCGDDGPTTTSAGTVPPAMAAQGDRGGAATGPAPASPLRDYASGGRDASAAEARPVRAGFRAFADAVVARDSEAACARVVGFEELLRANGQRGTCRDLLPDIGNSAAGPSPRDVELIDEADVVLAGDRATISVGSEAPVPMRRDAGAWKLDYAAFAATPEGR